MNPDFEIAGRVFSPSHPAIMGIVNCTPDSFSDGGRLAGAADAVEFALRLKEEGADIIDIGGESTRPGAAMVEADEELCRTISVIEGIRKKSRVPISIDTRKAVVAKAALEAGADMINDISAGRFDDEMLPLAARSQAPICLMHMQGEPATMQITPHYNDLIGEISGFLSEAIERAVRAGCDRSRLLIDPGIGFGKSATDNVEIIKRLGEFKKLEIPLLVGPSRKSFIGKLLDLDVDKRLEPTLATLSLSIDGGATVLRVHDAAPAKRFVDMYLVLKWRSLTRHSRNHRE